MFNGHDVVWQVERALNDFAMAILHGLARLEAGWSPPQEGWT